MRIGDRPVRPDCVFPWAGRRSLAACPGRMSCRSVLDWLAHHTHYAHLTAVTKSKWTKLLSYNWYDCAGMNALVMRTLR